MFRTISQTAVHYRDSSLSQGRAGRVYGGDRLPWVKPSVSGDPSAVDNFTLLTSLDWQVHARALRVAGVATTTRGVREETR
jgi:hypothetical protein